MSEGQIFIKKIIREIPISVDEHGYSGFLGHDKYQVEFTSNEVAKHDLLGKMFSFRDEKVIQCLRNINILEGKFLITELKQKDLEIAGDRIKLNNDVFDGVGVVDHNSEFRIIVDGVELTIFHNQEI